MIKLYRASNNAEADLILSLLEAHEINGTIQGYQHRSLLGVLGPYIQLDILVSEEDEAEARRLIDELKIESPQLSEHPPAQVSLRRPAVAMMMAFLFPGLGSLYLKRYQLGGWLLAGSAACFATLFFGIHAGPFPHTPYAAAALIALMICDMASALTFRYAKKPQLTVLSDETSN